MNTLMADTKAARGSRGRYMAAGYSYEPEERAHAGEAAQERSLYIAADRAGSARDNLRDLNRKGYAAGGETPKPYFEENVPGGRENRTVYTARKQTAARRLGFFEQMALEAERDKAAAALCVVLLAIILTIGVAGSARIIDRVSIQNEINEKHSAIEAYERQNDEYRLRIEMASQPDRIHQIAQNRLGMMRPRADMRQSILINAPDVMSAAQETKAESSFGLLDCALAMLNTFFK